MTDYPALKLFINDRWCSGEGRRTEPVLNPATGAVLGELPHATDADLDEALASSVKGHRAVAQDVSGRARADPAARCGAHHRAHRGHRAPDHA